MTYNKREIPILDLDGLKMRQLNLPQRRVKHIVWISSYNCLDYIDQCVNSVLSQDLSDFAVIIFDDCSDDGTYERLLDLEANNPEKLFLCSPLENTFVTGQRMKKFKILDLVKTDFVSLLDGDDFWNTGSKLSASETLLRNPAASLVFHELEVLGFSGGGKKDLYRHYFDSLIRVSGQSLVSGRIFPIVPTSSITFRSAEFPHDEIKCLGDKIGGDQIIKSHLSKSGLFVFDPNSKGTYRLRENSLWSSKSTLEQIRASLSLFPAILCASGIPGLLRFFVQNLILARVMMTSRLYSIRSNRR